MTEKKIRPYTKALLAAAVLGMVGYLFFFWQNDFYPALTGSQSTITLQKNAASQSVDVNKFDSLVKKISQKTATTTQENAINNPF
jgi:hypothetical protein